VSRTDTGISEVASETLIIAMIVVLTVIIVMLVFGLIPLTEKTAYLVPQFSITNVSGKTVITIFDRGGDPVYFNGSSLAKYKAELYVDTQAGSFRAVPSPTLTVFRPGDTVYAYYTGSGFILTNTLSGASFISLPAGKIAVRFIDATSGVLIAKEDLVMTAVTPTATAKTTTITTTTTTTTTTVTPSSHTITVSWFPWGLGSVSPPGGTKGGTVTVVHGNSQTFTATPDSNKAVLSITLDGAAVYTGSSTGIPISYTINNVVDDHTVAASFG
jgi:hypothetical protein